MFYACNHIETCICFFYNFKGGRQLSFEDFFFLKRKASFRGDVFLGIVEMQDLFFGVNRRSIVVSLENNYMNNALHLH